MFTVSQNASMVIVVPHIRSITSKKYIYNCPLRLKGNRKNCFHIFGNGQERCRAELCRAEWDPPKPTKERWLEEGKVPVKGPRRKKQTSEESPSTRSPVGKNFSSAFFYLRRHKVHIESNRKTPQTTKKKRNRKREREREHQYYLDQKHFVRLSSKEIWVIDCNYWDTERYDLSFINLFWPIILSM